MKRDSPYTQGDELTAVESDIEAALATHPHNADLQQVRGPRAAERPQ